MKSLKTSTIDTSTAPDCTTISYEESGTKSDPYHIENIYELQCIDDMDGYYELVSDIDATDTSGWNGGDGYDPIGNFSTPFTGTLYGNNYKIDSLYINRSGEYYHGIFGVTNGSRVDNMTLTNLYIESNTSTIGAISGSTTSTNPQKDVFKGITVSGTILGSYSTGGIVGEAYNASISNIDTDVGINTTIHDTYTAGGVVGDAVTNPDDYPVLSWENN